MQPKILSICIPTYNADEDFPNKIKDILEHSDERVEIVINDNCSTNNTVDKLRNINSDRLHIYTNETNNGPTYNYVKCLSRATGKYTLFLTDKDYIFSQNIDEVLNILTQNNYSVGYFELNSEKNKPQIRVFKDADESLYHLAYLSKHPSGYFYNTELMQKIDILNRFSSVDKVNYFPFEFICAELATHGNATIIDYCFIKTEKAKKGVTSKTYSKKSNNLFFTPENKYILFELYQKHLKILNPTNKSKLQLKLLKYLIRECTSTYKTIMTDKELAVHYGFEPTEITTSQQAQNLLYLLNRINHSKTFNILEKIKYCTYISIKLLGMYLYLYKKEKTNEIKTIYLLCGLIKFKTTRKKEVSNV